MHDVLMFFIQVAVAAVIAVKVVCDFVDDTELENHEDKKATVDDNGTVDDGKNVG